MTALAVKTRLSAEPLLEIARAAYRPTSETGLLAGDVVKLSRYLDVRYSTAENWIRDGLSPLQADRAATKAGRHPCELWGHDWAGR